jgi:hypothetical protein
MSEVITKKKVNGKNKGNNWERTIANLLSDKFKEYLNIEKAFIRNPNSGAFMGGKNQVRMKTHAEDFQTFGDILTPDNFRFVVECKHYKTPPSFDKFIKQDVKQWDTWIEQVTQDSVNSKKEMLLIIKYNNTEPFIIVDFPIGNGISPIFNYYKYLGYTLSDFMSIQDSFYFRGV